MNRAFATRVAQFAWVSKWWLASQDGKEQYGAWVSLWNGLLVKTIIITETIMIMIIKKIITDDGKEFGLMINNNNTITILVMHWWWMY